MGFVLEAACLCNTGKIRRNNEDNFYFDGRCLPADNNGLDTPLTMTAHLEHTVHLAVFDGMGGENFGELAAFAAADRMRGLLAGEKPVPAGREAAAELAQELNRAVVKKEKELLTRRMGSTMVSFCFSARSVLTCNLGDSRAYTLRGGEITQLSEDHVDKRSGQRKAPLTQHLGIDPEDFLLEPTVTERALSDGDRYLLCSDGLSDMLSDSEIAAILSGTATAQDCAEKLVAAALEQGGRDNITVIVCCIRSDGKPEAVGAGPETKLKSSDVGTPPPPPALKRYWPILAGVLGLLLLLALGYNTIHRWSDPSCDYPARCSICGRTRGAALGHDWSPWAITEEPGCTAPGMESRVCRRDASHVDTRRIPAAGHRWRGATCTEPSFCEVCGEKSGSPLGHAWAEAAYIWSPDADSVTAERVCSRCGETESETVMTSCEMLEGDPAAQRFIAVFLNPAFSTQEKIVTLPLPEEEPVPTAEESVGESPAKPEYSVRNNGKLLLIDGEGSVGGLERELENWPELTRTLRHLCVGPGITRIEAGAFSECAGLLSVVLKNPSVQIEDGAFPESDTLIWRYEQEETRSAP